ncbi:MAG: hypothetical protein KDK89_08900 [Alphaproteobacteria bacterium]|nr:hypothetical protein [Alphaproteobacteria bacterium]
MRRWLFTAIVGIAAVFAVNPAFAQARLPAYQAGAAAPKPLIKIIPPSVALNQAMMAAPNAKAIGVKLKGSLYIVKLKQGNKVTQVRVNATTGQVSP